jgi:methylmalonyl-CoA mutase N-terminal domain/subunit
MALAAAGFTVGAPIIAALAVAFTVGTIAVFLSDETNRAWLADQMSNGISDVQVFTSSLQEQLGGVTVYEAKGEYVPPGLRGDERNKYREAVHRYKRTWGLRANQNVPKDILDQIADAIKQGENIMDAADNADSLPESD